MLCNYHPPFFLYDFDPIASLFVRMSKGNREDVLAKAENDLAAVTDQYMSKLVKELDGTDFWKLRRAYTFAVSFCVPFCFGHFVIIS